MTNAYLQIEDIPGASKEADHEDWIQLTNCSQLITQPINAGANGRRPAGHAQWGDFTVYKEQDKASPLLAHAPASGKHFPKATIELVGAMGDKKNVFMKIVLEDVFIGQYGFQGGGLEPRPIEEVRFNFGKIKWEYTPDYIGEVGSPVVMGWNRDANKDAS